MAAHLGVKLEHLDTILLNWSIWASRFLFWRKSFKSL